MNKTKIEWVKNPDGTQGYTWNVITGCLNHNNGMCKGGNFPCYAYKLANGRLKQRYLHGGEFSTSLSYHDRYPGCLLDPFYPRFWPERLQDPLKHKKPAGIFSVDMGDWCGDWIPIEWSHAIIGMIMACPQHRFYLLTKQPQNLIKFSPFPDNCYVGVTATNQEMWDKAIYWLGFLVEARVKFISIEPFLQPIHTSPVLLYDFAKKENLIHQIIIGAQTNPYKPPKWGWVSGILDTCADANIPYFLKNNMEKVVPKGPYGGDLIQEMPKC